MSAPTHDNPQSISVRESKTLQTLGDTTCNPLLVQRNQDDILDWLEQNASEVIIQTIPAGKRLKNRCVVSFRDPRGQTLSVGGTCIAGAVWRARVRVEASADSSARGGNQ